MTEENIKDELESIKRLLILQLIHNGIPHADVAKAAGISTKTIYKFITKNHSSVKTGKNHE